MGTVPDRWLRVLGPEKQPEHQLKRKPSPILLMPHRTRPAASGYTTQTEPTSTHYR